MATKLFTDVPAAAANIPGMVTPNVTEDIRPQANWADIAAAMGLQQRMKANSADRWARAAAINNANAAQANAWKSQPHYSTPTELATSGMGAQYRPEASQGSVMWAPRGMDQAHLGTWAAQQQNKAIQENREMPTILQAHRNDPYSPGEQGSGGPYLGRGIYGPGLTSPMGGANPAVWAKMWGGK